MTSSPTDKELKEKVLSCLEAEGKAPTTENLLTEAIALHRKLLAYEQQLNFLRLRLNPADAEEASTIAIAEKYPVYRLFTNRERALFDLLLAAKDRFLSREYLRQNYTTHEEESSKLIEVFLTKIRQKLRATGTLLKIENAFGRGWRLVESTEPYKDLPDVRVPVYWRGLLSPIKFVLYQRLRESINRPVPAEELINRGFSTTGRVTQLENLRSHISHLRRILEPKGFTIKTYRDGYALIRLRGHKRKEYPYTTNRPKRGPLAPLKKKNPASPQKTIDRGQDPAI